MKLKFKGEGYVKLEKDPVKLSDGDVIEVSDKFGKHLLKTNRHLTEFKDKGGKR